MFFHGFAMDFPLIDLKPLFADSRYGLLTERELVLPENQKAPSSRRLLAVPFVAKDKPSPAAEFAQPDVLIGFTVQLGAALALALRALRLAYRYEGMRLSDTVTMLHHLQMKSGRVGALDLLVPVEL